MATESRDADGHWALGGMATAFERVFMAISLQGVGRRRKTPPDHRYSFGTGVVRGGNDLLDSAHGTTYARAHVLHPIPI